MRAAAAALLALAATSPAFACSYAPDERSWEARIADEPVIFVGRVIAILDPDAMAEMERGDCGPDTDASQAIGDRRATCVIFRVEQQIIGAQGTIFEVPQGHNADCAIGFEVGQRWLYAGNFIGGPSEQLDAPLSRTRLNSIKRAVR